MIQLIISLILKGLCHPWRMREPMKKGRPDFYKFCRRVWKSEFEISTFVWKLAKFCIKIRSMVIAEEFLALFWNCLSLRGIFFFTWIYSVLLSAAVVMAES